MHISVVFSPLCRANSAKSDYMGCVAISVPAKRVDSTGYTAAVPARRDNSLCM